MYANTYCLGYYRQGAANLYVINEYGDLVLIGSYATIAFNILDAKCSV